MVFDFISWKGFEGEEISWNPSQLPSLICWLDAKDPSFVQLNNNQKVSQWSDRSGNNRHAIQWGTRNLPTYSGNSILFSSSPSLLAASYLAIQNNLSVFMVVKRRYPSANVGYFRYARLVSFYNSQNFPRNPGDFGNLNSWMAVFSSQEDNYLGNPPPAFISYRNFAPITAQSIQFDKFYIVGSSLNNSNGSLRVNGISSGGTTPSTPLNSDLILIGGSPVGIDGEFCGEISEVVISANLVLADQQKIEGYLAHKWSLLESLPADHPYKSIAP